MAMYPIHKNSYIIRLTDNGAKLEWDSGKPEINDELIKLLDSGKRIITQQDIPDDQFPQAKLLHAGDTVTKDFILNNLLGNINNRYVDLEDYDEVLKRIENGETEYKPEMNYMGLVRDPGPGYAKTNIPTVATSQLKDGYLFSHGDDSDDDDDESDKLTESLDKIDAADGKKDGNINVGFLADSIMQGPGYTTRDVYWDDDDNKVEEN